MLRVVYFRHQHHDLVRRTIYDCCPLLESLEKQDGDIEAAFKQSGSYRQTDGFPQEEEHKFGWLER